MNVKEIAKHRSGFFRNPFLYPSHGKVARKIESRNLMREMDHGMVHYDRYTKFKKFPLYTVINTVALTCFCNSLL